MSRYEYSGIHPLAMGTDSMSWADQVRDGKFPTCKEVCTDCQEGRHIFHILNELADLSAVKRTYHLPDGRSMERIYLEGWCDDEMWLDNLLEQIGFAYYSRIKKEHM